MPEKLGAPLPVRATHPHPAPAKLDDVSLSLLNPPERLSKGPLAGEGIMRGGGGEGISGNGQSDSEFVIDDALACAIRDRLLVIPGVREAARELGLLPGRVLHSACIATPPPSIARALGGSGNRRGSFDTGPDGRSSERVKKLTAMESRAGSFDGAAAQRAQDEGDSSLRVNMI
jgi:hypothetical protein